ncbi:MAG: polysaccharide deacetylase [Alphaproteobacteria bacterium]|nr:polysaccharide deacetylase [Alphaproteobacteria bacterium]
MVERAAWRELEGELRRWRDHRRQPSFWLRDDDTEAMSPPLGRLLDLCHTHAVPVALAAIPGRCLPSLPGALAGLAADSTLLVHGLNHDNHAPADEKKSEFGPHRPLAAMRDDLRRALTTARALFGDALLPVLVPPWNRLDERMATHLAECGFTGLSAKGPRQRPAVTGVTVRDAHIDIIDWRGRRFRGEEATLAALVQHLRRRQGDESDECTGLLTHHRVLDDAAWAFLDRLFAVTAELGGCWLGARTLFPVGS